MRWQKHDTLIPHDEIIKQIGEARQKGYLNNQLALGYARVSTKHPEQINSKEDQVTDCREYAQRKGLYLIHVFECAESAKAQGRKVFNTLIESAIHYNIKHLILKDTSRLTRNLGDKDRINQLVKQEKMQFHFYLTGDILTSESRMLISNIMAVIDADFSELLSIKMKYVVERKREMGSPVQVPTGYKFGRTSSGEVDTSVIKKDPKFEKAIHEIFNQYLSQNKTYLEIANFLNGMKYKTKQDRPFYPSTIQRILANKFYTGKWFYVAGEGFKKIKVSCPAYVSEEQFNEIQRQVKLKKTSPNRRKHREYLLTGLLLCECGNMASGYNWNGKNYYGHKCKDKNKKKSYWPERTILEAIDAEIENYNFDEEYSSKLKDRLNLIVRKKGNANSEINKEIADNIKTLKDRKNNLLDNLLDKTITKEDYKKKSGEIETMLEALQDKLDMLQVESNLEKWKGDAAQVIDEIKDFVIAYKSAMKEEKIYLLRNMVKWLYFDDEKIKVEWKSPFNLLLEKATKNIKNIKLYERVADGT